MVRQIHHPEYQLEHLPGFEHLVFSEQSTNRLASPQSVAFATEHGGVLQSAREAWACRVDSNGTLDSDKYQSTRTAALGVLLNSRYTIAIADSDNPDENLLLAKPQEGYEAHRTGGRWLVSRADPVVRRMLDRAQDEGRTFPALEDTLKLSTKQNEGVSAYGSHLAPQAILGADLTQRVAQYLHERDYRNGYVWTLSPRNLHDLGVDDDHVEVRRVGVGGGNSIYIASILYAGGLCNDNGRARGVRTISSGNGRRLSLPTETLLTLSR